MRAFDQYDRIYGQIIPAVNLIKTYVKPRQPVEPVLQIKREFPNIKVSCTLSLVRFTPRANVNACVDAWKYIVHRFMTVDSHQVLAVMLVLLMLENMF